jgi:hypothetical protein
MLAGGIPGNVDRKDLKRGLQKDEGPVRCQLAGRDRIQPLKRSTEAVRLMSKGFAFCSSRRIVQKTGRVNEV